MYWDCQGDLDASSLSMDDTSCDVYLTCVSRDVCARISSVLCIGIVAGGLCGLNFILSPRKIFFL